MMDQIFSFLEVFVHQLIGLKLFEILWPEGKFFYEVVSHLEQLQLSVLAQIKRRQSVVVDPELGHQSELADIDVREFVVADLQEFQLLSYMG